MPIDPNIALGVRPIEVANPINAYAQMAQIQNAQNQNALAQYQLSAAQRADLDQQLIRNTLAGKVYGTPEYEAAVSEAYTKTGNVKGLQELKEGKLKTTKLQGEIDKNQFELQQKKFKQAWENAGVASTPQIAIEQLTTAVNNGDVDPATAAREIQNLQNMPQEQYAKWRLEKIASVLDAKDKFAAMAPKFARENIGGSIVAIQDNPMLPGYGLPVAGVTSIAKTPTPGELLADARAREKLAQDERSVVYQTDDQGNVVALPSKLRAGEVPRARMAVAPGAGMVPLEGKPSEKVASERLSINQQKATVQGALDAVKNTPDAFGWATGNMPESVRGRMATPAENEARAFVFNVVSGVIKERAGTAQSAGEAATLARFLPADTDNADIIKDKLTGFQKYLSAKESGTGRQPKKETPTLSATGNSVTLPDGRVMTFPDANAASQFKKAAGL